MRESNISSDGSHNIVMGNTLSTHIGDVALDALDVDIMFGLDPASPPRPRFPRTNEYLAFTWLQSQQFAYTPLFEIVDSASLKTWDPYYSGLNDGSQYVDEFSLPRSELTRPCLLVFILPDRHPAVVSLESLARFALILAQSGQMGDESAPEVRSLRKLDPSLFAKPKLRPRAQRIAIRSIPPASVATAADTAASASSDSAVAHDHNFSGYYSGDITDQAAGSGTLTLDLSSATNQTWTATFQNALENNGGLISGAVWQGDRLLFVMDAKDANRCSYSGSASLNEDVLSGEYQGIARCSTNGGTFRLKRSGA